MFVSLSSRRLSITTGVFPYPLPSRSNHTFTGTVVPLNLNAFTRARTVNLFLMATGSGSSTTSAMATSLADWLVPGSPTATVWTGTPFSFHSAAASTGESGLPSTRPLPVSAPSPMTTCPRMNLSFAHCWRVRRRYTG